MKYLPTEAATLLKSCNTLVQLVTVYLLFTWGYQGLHFVLETIGKVFTS